MKKYFEEMKLFFSAGLNELDLIKLKKPLKRSQVVSLKETVNCTTKKLNHIFFLQITINLMML